MWCVCVSVWVCAHEYRCPWDPYDNRVRAPRITNSCELPAMKAGDTTSIPCKSCRHSLLITEHFLAPREIISFQFEHGIKCSRLSSDNMCLTE